MRPRRLERYLLVGIALHAAALLVTLARASADTPPPELHLAFWGFFVGALSAIWGAFVSVGSALASAAWWLALKTWTGLLWLANATASLGGKLASIGRKIWSGVEALYDHVLRPVWQKFWSLVDRVRGFLERYGRKIINFLQTVRKHILDFYAKWVRPWLDLIDVSRKVLQVLGRLGVDWARALDRRLFEVQGWVNDRLLDLLRPLNATINLVNRVVTADGLFQRLALIRSIERDVKYIAQALSNARDQPLTDQQRAQAAEDQEQQTLAEAAEELRLYLSTGAGPRAAFIEELAAQWRLSLSGQR